MLKIIINDRPHPDIIGYTIRLVDSSFPDTIFPDATLVPIELGNGRRGFLFPWLDITYRHKKPQPIDARIEIRRVSQAGKEGTARILHILDAGGA